MSETKKTCRSFAADGKCRFGDGCRYSHGVEPHHDEKTTECRHFAKGKCNRGDDCKFLHSKSTAGSAEDSDGVEQEEEALDPSNPNLTDKQWLTAFRLLLQTNEEEKLVINTLPTDVSKTFLETGMRFKSSPSMASRARLLTRQLSIDMSMVPQAYQDFVISGKSTRETSAAPRTAHKATSAGPRTASADTRTEHKKPAPVTSLPARTQGEKHVPAKAIKAILDMSIPPGTQLELIRALIS